MQRKMVRREPHMMSKVPRPFGELTQPCWCPEDVAFAVLAAIASPRYKLKMKKRYAIVRCAAHCPPATQESGIIAGNSMRFQHWTPQSGFVKHACTY